MNRAAGWGLAVWAGLGAAAAAGAAPLGLLELLFLLAAWVVVPLGIPFLPDDPLVRAVGRLAPLAAALASASFLAPKGTLAAALAVPWLALDGLLALAGLIGLGRAVRGGTRGVLLASAMMLPPVGGINLVASRLGYALGGFPEPIVLLTAIHFHYTAFAAPILAALSCGALTGGGRRVAEIGGLGLVAAIPPIAVGFLSSPRLKAAGVVLMAASVGALATGQLLALLRLRSPASRLFLGISSAAVAAGIVLAVVFEHGVFTGRTWISIPQMARTHGLLNGLGFSLSGLLAWTTEQRRARRDPA
jgi:hypothetical protein